MRVLLTLLKKEFKQIFRNRIMIPIMFVMPLIMLFVLLYAANQEMKNIDIVMVDKDFSQASRRLVSHFDGSPFFTLVGSTTNFTEAEALIISNKADAILHIESGFEKELFTEKHADIQIVVNAINAIEAGLINAYCTQIITAYNSSIRSEWFEMNHEGMMMKLDISMAFWYNPLLDYKIYMLPGILVILVTLIGMFLTAINLVREKELGTAEQINVTPIRKYQFLVAKLLPFLLIGLFELSFGLTIGKLLIDLPMEGSLLLLFAFATVYLIVALAIGLLISTFSNTQQQMMFVAFFFVITFILMSGLFTPAESMPLWAQKINVVNPLSYFMRVNRMILLKGSGFQDISRDFFSMLIYAGVLLTLAISNYRKTT